MKLPYLFRILGRKNRLYLAYQQEWLRWDESAAYGDTFPTFEEWLTTRKAG